MVLNYFREDLIKKILTNLRTEAFKEFSNIWSRYKIDIVFRRTYQGCISSLSCTTSEEAGGMQGTGRGQNLGYPIKCGVMLNNKTGGSWLTGLLQLGTGLGLFCNFYYYYYSSSLFCPTNLSFSQPMRITLFCFPFLSHREHLASYQTKLQQE